MVNLAELKSHVRNEHLRNSNKKVKLRDRFNAQKEQSQISIAHSSNLILSSSAARQSIPTSGSTRTGSDVDDDNTPTHDDSGTLAVTRTPSEPDFRRIISQCVTQAEIDDEDDEPLFPTGPLPRETMTRLPLIPIQELFNFENMYWQSLIKATVTSTFDRELEVYNMLDLDADGEDVEVDVDDATGEIVS